MTDSQVVRGMEALSRFFVGDGTLRETMERVSALTVEAVPAAEMVGITIVVEGRERTAVFTDELAPEIDQAQYDSGDGPCLEAFETQRITEIGSTRESGPWPEFRQAAASHGIGSTLSFPMIVDGRTVGAMNVYARPERAFDDTDRDTGMLFASQAAIVLANSQAYWDARELGARLGEAMEHRAVIEQAKGLLMGSEGYSEDEAFQLLVRVSQRENVKLREIARRLVNDAGTRGGSRRDIDRLDQARR